MTQRIYRTMLGKEIDMVALMTKNETQPAVGNAKMNARGDELGPGGRIVRTRADVVADYYEDNPNAKKTVRPAVVDTADNDTISVSESLTIDEAVPSAPTRRSKKS